jgi:hypothetical protein
MGPPTSLDWGRSIATLKVRLQSRISVESKCDTFRIVGNPEVIVGLDSPTRLLVPQSVQSKIVSFQGVYSRYLN